MIIIILIKSYSKKFLIKINNNILMKIQIKSLNNKYKFKILIKNLFKNNIKIMKRIKK